MTVQRARCLAGRFELESPVARGGMGAVYRAKDLTTGESVALKLLTSHGSEDADRFAREARLLSQLSHPAIVRYVAHGATDAGELYLALEWLEGIDLRARLRGGRLPVDETLAVVLRIAEALSVAHRRGIVHRDVKPSNVFLPGGRVEDAKLLDFGVARLRQGATAVTRTGTAVGTPGYMAPEQARGDTIDSAVDVFALGCVLHECLTGQPPFDAQDTLAILLKVMLEDPPRLRDVLERIPPELDELTARMLSKSRGERPANAQAVTIELRDLQSQATAETPTARSRILTTAERRMLCLLRRRATSRREPPAAGVHRRRRSSAACTCAPPRHTTGAETSARLPPRPRRPWTRCPRTAVRPISPRGSWPRPADAWATPSRWFASPRCCSPLHRRIWDGKCAALGCWRRREPPCARPTPVSTACATRWRRRSSARPPKTTVASSHRSRRGRSKPARAGRFREVTWPQGCATWSARRSRSVVSATCAASPCRRSTSATRTSWWAHTSAPRPPCAARSPPPNA